MNQTSTFHAAAGSAARGAPTLLPGFADAVAGAQATFRVALQALANPGSVHALEPDCGVPPGLSPAMTAMLLALADVDAPVWLPESVDEGVRAFLRFHCACRLVDDPAHARFVAVPAGCAAPSLDRCDPGDPAYPDTSATLLIEVASLAQGETASPAQGEALTLSGPGIPGRRALSATGLPADFAGQWARNHKLFPLGVDAFLTQGKQLCGLPRTTRMEN